MHPSVRFVTIAIRSQLSNPPYCYSTTRSEVSDVSALTSLSGQLQTAGKRSPVEKKNNASALTLRLTRRNGERLCPSV